MSSEEHPTVATPAESHQHGQPPDSQAVEAHRGLPSDRAQQIIDDAAERLGAIIRVVGRRLARPATTRAHDAGGESGVSARLDDSSTAQQDGARSSAAPAAGTSALPADRAEQLLDEFAERFGEAVHTFGRPLLKYGAQAQEELEDLWVDAQQSRTRTRERVAEFSEELGNRTGDLARRWGRRLSEAAATVRKELVDMREEADREVRERHKNG